MNTFSPEANYALRFVNETNRSIFLTGKAGTGKTTLLKQIISTTHKNCVIVAPTGIAALNAGGVTIHSFFQLPFGAFVPDSNSPPIFDDSVKFENRVSIKRHMKMNNARRALFINMDLLVIDEVSMLRADVLDAMDFILKTVRRNQQPFGGVQVLFIGDLLQLPPVVKNQEWDILKRYYDGVYFFHSEVIRNNPPLYIELEKIYRQSDQIFIQILNNLRNNSVTQDDIKILNGFIKPDFDVMKNPGYITLTTHNSKADKMNEDALKVIKSKEFSYQAQIVGDFPDKIFPLEHELQLKVGAQVIFIKNDLSSEKRYYNGKMGVIKTLSNNEIFVHFPQDNITIEVDRYEWENIKYTVNPNTKEITEEVMGTYTHYPIKLAWAITVHKSQGLTFDKAVLDVSKVFLPGQAYVALSRLRSLEGLVLLSGLQMNGLVNDFDVMSFSNNKASSAILASELEHQTKMFLKKYFIDTFTWFQLIDQWQTHMYSYREESDKSDKQSYRNWARNTHKSLSEMHIIAQGFVKQLNALFDEEEFRFSFVKQRIEKAYSYFFPKLDHLVFELLFNIAQLKGQRKAKSLLVELSQLEDNLIKTVIALKKSLKMVEIIEKDLPISKENLRSLAISEYKINHLVAISQIIQSTTLGFDNQDDSLDFIDSKAGEKSKVKKKSTFTLTLELLNQGLNTEQIAERRKLTTTTIYSHYAKLINDESLILEQVMSQDIIDELKLVFDKFKSKSLSEIKAEVEEKYSWEELKLYQRVTAQ